MHWFRNLRTAKKLLSGFGVMAALIGFVGWWGLDGMGTVNGMLNTLYERDTVGLSAVKEANLDLIYISRALRSVLLSKDPAEMKSHIARITKYEAALNTHLDVTEKTLFSEEGKQKFRQVRAALPEYMRIVQEATRLAEAGKKDEALDGVIKGRALADRLDDDMAGVAETKEKLAKQAFEQSDVVFSQTRNVLIGLSIVAALLALVLGWTMAKMISAPLQQSVSILKKVAAGDLTQTFELQTTDEVGDMARALNEAVGSMRKAMLEVRGSADRVSGAAQQLSAASEELASGARSRLRARRRPRPRLSRSVRP